MKRKVARKILKRLVVGLLLFLCVFFLGMFLLARLYVEPTLRKRIETLIVEGSDSLYTYQLKGLSTNVFGGNIEVTDFEMRVDSNRYRQLQQSGSLPALVVGVNVKKARIRGIGVFSLLFSKKIYVTEISSSDADVNVLRNFRKEDTSTAVTKNRQPLWKTMRPTIKDLDIGRISLNGIRLLYRNTEDYDAAQLKFERCDALFEKIRIDSAAMADSSRLGYVKDFSLRFRQLSFRSPDSLYQMTAAGIAYDSKSRYLQMDSFGLAPTLDKNQRFDSLRRSYYTFSFRKAGFSGLRLDRYLRLNRAEADSLVFESPRLAIYQDKIGLKNYRSKIGHYPHQELLQAGAVIDIRKFITHDLALSFTERQEDTREEGTVKLEGLEVAVNNVVNDTALIRRDPVATATAAGTIIGSPIAASFRFYLDSAEGKFDVTGSLQNVTAAQINPLSSTLANVEVPSADIERLDFFVRGQDYNATADVRMRYSNLSVVFLKRDKATGENEVRGFLTNLLNKYAIYTSNPASGAERKASGVKVARLTTQSFFGVIWQAVFAGMQAIVLKT